MTITPYSHQSPFTMTPVAVQTSKQQHTNTHRKGNTVPASIMSKVATSTSKPYLLTASDLKGRNASWKDISEAIKSRKEAQPYMSSGQAKNNRIQLKRIHRLQRNILGKRLSEKPERTVAPRGKWMHGRDISLRDPIIPETPYAKAMAAIKSNNPSQLKEVIFECLTPLSWQQLEAITFYSVKGENKPDAAILVPPKTVGEKIQYTRRLTDYLCTNLLGCDGSLDEFEKTATKGLDALQRFSHWTNSGTASEALYWAKDYGHSIFHNPGWYKEHDETKWQPLARIALTFQGTEKARAILEYCGCEDPNADLFTVLLKAEREGKIGEGNYTLGDFEKIVKQINAIPTYFCDMGEVFNYKNTDNMDIIFHAFYDHCLPHIGEFMESNVSECLRRFPTKKSCDPNDGADFEIFFWNVMDNNSYEVNIEKFGAVLERLGLARAKRAFDDIIASYMASKKAKETADTAPPAGRLLTASELKSRNASAKELLEAIASRQKAQRYMSHKQAEGNEVEISRLNWLLKQTLSAKITQSVTPRTEWLPGYSSWGWYCGTPACEASDALRKNDLEKLKTIISHRLQLMNRRELQALTFYTVKENEKPNAELLALPMTVRGRDEYIQRLTDYLCIKELDLKKLAGFSSRLVSLTAAEAVNRFKRLDKDDFNKKDGVIKLEYETKWKYLAEIALTFQGRKRAQQILDYCGCSDKDADLFAVLLKAESEGKIGKDNFHFGDFEKVMLQKDGAPTYLCDYNIQHSMFLKEDNDDNMLTLFYALYDHCLPYAQEFVESDVEGFLKGFPPDRVPRYLNRFKNVMCGDSHEVNIAKLSAVLEREGLKEAAQALEKIVQAFTA